MSAFGRRFSLSDQRGHGVSCDNAGIFIGDVPLLETCRNCGGFQKWRPRPLDEINRDLSMRYGVPMNSARRCKVSRNRRCARSWRSPARAHRDLAFGDFESACARERSPVRNRVCSSRKGAPLKRDAQAGLGPVEASALAGWQPAQRRRPFCPGGCRC